VDNDLINKRKNLGYPRINGHCQVHEATQLPLKYDGNILKGYDDFNNYEYDQKWNIIYRKDLDLVRGDLISCSGYEQPYIFDGCKVIELDNTIDDYGSLPQEFTVLSNVTNGVPANYWSNDQKHNVKGISHNSFIWFDITENIRDQLINNIKDDGELVFKQYFARHIGSGKLYYTDFVINEKIYYIINSFIDIGTNIFADVLSTKSKILLEHYSLTEVLLNQDNLPNNILFLSLYYNDDINLKYINNCGDYNDQIIYMDGVEAIDDFDDFDDI
jgi:hypothetical protein